MHWAAAQVRSSFRDTTWQAFWQTAILHRDVTEVAKELGMSSGAIYVARSRIIARIRQTIDDNELDSGCWPTPANDQNDAEESHDQNHV